MSSLTEVRVAVGAKTIVDAVKADYPGFNKCLLSQCENGQKYGVRLLAGAAEIVGGLLPPEVPKRRPERRKKTNRYYFRLNDTGAMMLSKLCQQMGCETVQELCEILIKREAFRRGIRI